MIESLEKFERIVRKISVSSVNDAAQKDVSHPFDERNIHSDISAVSKRLFDDGHYSQSTFEAFKFLDIQVKNISGVKDSGHKLMMTAFSETSPRISLTNLSSSSEIDEQSGYRFIFAGAMSAIRNPRGHEINFDPVDRCLDHLSLASVLLRRLEDRIH